MTPHDSEKLERLIHQTLRSLPDRRAPHTLEQRVFAAIATQASRPWWRQSFLQWPLAARVTFLVLCAGLVQLLLYATGFAIGDVQSGHVAHFVARPLAWVDLILGAFSGVADFFSVMLRAIPPLWLYGGLAVIVSLYLALFGLGAAAYRALYVQR